MDLDREVIPDRSYSQRSLRGGWEIRSNYSFLLSRAICRGEAGLC